MGRVAFVVIGFSSLLLCGVSAHATCLERDGIYEGCIGFVTGIEVQETSKSADVLHAY